MDNCELFFRIPGALKANRCFSTDGFGQITIVHGRKELVAQMGSVSKYEWDIKPRFFTFPDMQEVCETEITIVVRDE